MGNCIHPESQTATLIDGHGRLRQIQLPITVVEIMLDHPGHIVASETLIRQTRHIIALASDDELRPANTYLLVPLGRANSRVSRPEMELVDYACHKSMRSAKRSRSNKALSLNNKDFKCLPDISVGDGNKLRKGNSCPWRPALEPIFEESGSFRVNC